MLRGTANLAGGGSPITGTTITATVGFRAAAGSTSAVSYGFSDAANTGFYEVSTADIGVVVAGTERFRFPSSGIFNVPLGFATGSSISSPNASFVGVANNAINYASSVLAGAGAVTSRTEINKAVTAIANNTATAVFTVTIPNAAHSGSIRVRLTGSLGAGGAIGANESTQDAEYMVNITRTAGANAVATIGAVVGQAAAASVAGANNAAVTATLGAISGAVGATNTFTVQVTIARSAGTSDNHTCFGFAELLNANGSGITIA